MANTDTVFSTKDLIHDNTVKTFIEKNYEKLLEIQNDINTNVINTFNTEVINSKCNIIIENIEKENTLLYYNNIYELSSNIKQHCNNMTMITKTNLAFGDFCKKLLNDVNDFISSNKTSISNNVVNYCDLSLKKLDEQLLKVNTKYPYDNNSELLIRQNIEDYRKSWDDIIAIEEEKIKEKFYEVLYNTHLHIDIATNVEEINCVILDLFSGYLQRHCYNNITLLKPSINRIADILMNICKHIFIKVDEMNQKFSTTYQDYVMKLNELCKTVDISAIHKNLLNGKKCYTLLTHEDRSQLNKRYIPTQIINTSASKSEITNKNHMVKLLLNEIKYAMELITNNNCYKITLNNNKVITYDNNHDEFVHLNNNSMDIPFGLHFNSLNGNKQTFTPYHTNIIMNTDLIVVYEKYYEYIYDYYQYNTIGISLDEKTGHEEYCKNLCRNKKKYNNSFDIIEFDDYFSTVLNVECNELDGNNMYIASKYVINNLLLGLCNEINYKTSFIKDNFGIQTIQNNFDTSTIENDPDPDPDVMLLNNRNFVCYRYRNDLEKLCLIPIKNRSNTFMFIKSNTNHRLFANKIQTKRLDDKYTISC